MDTSDIKNLGHFCIKSYNYVISHGAQKAIDDIEPVYTSNDIKISITETNLTELCYPPDTRKNKRKVYPSEARLRFSTYHAELDVQLRFETKSSDVEYAERTFYVPVMVKSNLCLLNGLQENDLIEKKEDVNDPGGYFIVKGKERFIRHFIVPKRNYPLALSMNKWKTYRKNYTEFGILTRSVKDEHIFSNVSLHFLKDGGYEICLHYKFNRCFFNIMLILKALVDKSDREVCYNVIKYSKDFPMLILKNMLLKLAKENIYSQNDAKKRIGKYLHSQKLADWHSSFIEAADNLFLKSLFVHLNTCEDKFEYLCFCLSKLHCVISKQYRLDDIDNPVYQEVLSCGQTYLQILKAGLRTYLKSVKDFTEKKFKNNSIKFTKDNLRRICNLAPSLSPYVAAIVSTGNFSGKYSDFDEKTGYTIALKRTNVFQLASQLTAVCKFAVPHYSAMKRRFYSESFGFICPTQTPEGENCGLYNHLASQCKIVELGAERMDPYSLYKFGVVPVDDPVICNSDEYYPVVVDGKIIGWIYKVLTEKLIIRLKYLKISNTSEVPYHTEIAYISDDEHLFAGVYIYSSPCRMIRKTLNLIFSKTEFIGVFEQTFLGAFSDSDNMKTHFLSLSAAMIPYFENNYGVRNIYSSVKVKQALGFPFYNFCGHSDSKFSHLMYPQTPIVNNSAYSESNFSLYPHGTNVIMAVVSYSGYDMEDAITLNKSSVENGLMTNMTYKTVMFDFDFLSEDCNCKLSELEFRRNMEDKHAEYYLDEDGLPLIGARMTYNCPLLSCLLSDNNTHKVHLHMMIVAIFKTGWLYCNIICVHKKGSKDFVLKYYSERHVSYVTAVRIMDDVPSKSTVVPKASKKISITYCMKLCPAVGDKFSNGHGGKGICSVLMPREDLPFTADGIVPDVLFNPHGLPSRMSIGLLFEMASAKVHIVNGSKCVVEPFKGGKTKTYENIGKALTEAGFDHWGTEKFYSGTSGEELEANVFCGSVYYLRLDHIVQEKYQVRSTGPVDERTFQPINPGRSGAIRFGEMERDAIISHGAANLTLDRLLFNSDVCTAYLCTSCHQILLPVLPHHLPELRSVGNVKPREEYKPSFCKLCEEDSTSQIQIPYVLIYLISELSVLGIRVNFFDKDISRRNLHYFP